MIYSHKLLLIDELVMILLTFNKIGCIFYILYEIINCNHLTNNLYYFLIIIYNWL